MVTSQVGWCSVCARWLVRAAALARCLALLLAALTFGSAWAAGTTAGSLIRNTATLSYTYGGVPTSQQATASPVSVAQVLAVRTTWQDATATTANSPDSLRVLTFAVTNTGNGTATFTLARDNAVTGDQFDPTDAPQGGTWIESGAQPGLQVSGPNADIPYVAGTNDPVLAPDASRIVYLASSIPFGFTTGATGRVTLRARAILAPANAAAGDQVGVQNGVVLVAGAGGGRSAATGTYLVAVVAIGVSKTVPAIADPQGGNRVMPGSILTYRVTVTASGTGTASNIVITDPLPAEISYVPGSITVDGTARTDAADGDDSTFTSNTVRTVLPSLAAPQSRVIEFKAKVN